MSAPRELRVLVPFEVGAVIAIAIAWPYVTWSELVPFSLPLVICASASRWARGRSWGELAGGGPEQVAIGALVGAVALVAAIVVGTPIVERLANRAVEWSAYGFVRGNAMQIAVFGLYVAVAAVAAELALRGWLVERVLELSPGPPVLPVLAGAIAEAALAPGGLGARIGAGVFGMGLGWIYVASGRRVTAPICARVVFACGALVLEGFKVIG